MPKITGDRKDVVKVNISKDLTDHIDLLIHTGNIGYSSRDAFVEDAVRVLLEHRLAFIKSLKDLKPDK